MVRPKRNDSGSAAVVSSPKQTEVTIDSLSSDMAAQFFQLLMQDPSDEVLEAPVANVVEQNIAKTLGISEESVAVYNPTSRFLIPEVSGLVRLDQSVLNKTSVKTTTRFLRAGLFASTGGDNAERLEKVVDLVGDLVGSTELHRKKKQTRSQEKRTAGKMWYDLPATELTDEIKNDFLLLRNRGALYADRFYKKEKGNVFPKFFQVGTIVEGVTDNLSHGRINKRDRKSTIAEEILAEKSVMNNLKKRYNEHQLSKSHTKRKFSGKYDTNKKKRK